MNKNRVCYKNVIYSPMSPPSLDGWQPFTERILERRIATILSFLKKNLNINNLILFNQ